MKIILKMSDAWTIKKTRRNVSYALLRVSPTQRSDTRSQVRFFLLQEWRPVGNHSCVFFSHTQVLAVKEGEASRSRREQSEGEGEMSIDADNKSFQVKASRPMTWRRDRSRFVPTLSRLHCCLNLLLHTKVHLA